MNRRDLLKIFSGLVVAPVALKAALSNTTSTLPTQPTPTTINSVYHPRISYMPLLREMGGVTFSDRPCFLIDWDTMNVQHLIDEGRLIDHIGTYMPAIVKTITLRSKEWGIEFVRANKRNMVVHDFFLQPWTEFPNVCSDPIPYLRYVHRPGSDKVYPLA
jgi:hypothetical protein